jgi:two-component system, chemotaxis family, sensor kinase CheA
MTGILSKAFLPSRISETERAHVMRVNRIALWFFAAHIPVFALIAFLNNTNPGQAAALTAGIWFGPLIAHKTMSNPRHVALVYGITAMAMGGLLVHVGQGPMQIEMHFYFFALIAMLSVYGNPAVIYISAATVALHHLLLWLVLPRSVFNYEASMWVVAVHAAFVVLESIATAFIARSFFDNVIHLEQIVAARSKDIQLILDNVGQGFLTLDAGGRMAREHSRAVVEWFGPFEPGVEFADYVTRYDVEAGQAFRDAWRRVTDGHTPTEVAISRLPRRMRLGDRHMEILCRPVIEEGVALDKFVIVISDITARVEAERLETEQKETAMLVNHMIGANSNFIERIKNDPALGRGQRETLVMIYQRFIGNGGSTAKKRSIFDTAPTNPADDIATARALDELD